LRAQQGYRAAMTSGEAVSGLQQVILNERGRLLRFLAARGAGDEAEGVLHDLWQRVAASPSEPIADSVSYLFRAAENLMRDRRRSSMSRARRQQEWHEVSVPETEAPKGERALIAREQLRRVETALAELGPRADHVFRRYRLDGVGQAVIARELGVSLSSVEKDLQKAYRALAQLKVAFDAD
jgi:RNA polymerase sigma factor (sigma-70 family)